jgi:hypothetical protein
MILQQRLKLLVDFKIFLWYNVGKLKRKDQAQFLPCLRKAEVSLREMMKFVVFSEKHEPYLYSGYAGDLFYMQWGDVAYDYLHKSSKKINENICIRVGFISCVGRGKSDFHAVWIPIDFLRSVAHFKKEYSKLFKTLSDAADARDKEQAENLKKSKELEKYKQYVALKKEFGDKK